MGVLARPPDARYAVREEWMADQQVLGVEYGGRPVFGAAGEQLYRPQPIPEGELIFDEVQAGDGGRLTIETGYEGPATTTATTTSTTAGTSSGDTPIDSDDLKGGGVE